MGGTRSVSVAVCLVTVVALTACASSGNSQTAAERTRAGTPSTSTAPPTLEEPTCGSGHTTKGYPSSIAVLGHSFATGEDSDPKNPGADAPENSWATGTNPKVNSVYSRILAENPAIEGCKTNLAEGGATVDDMMQQAQEVLDLSPVPELILIVAADNDIVCPAGPSDYADFRSRFTAVLNTLAEGAPHSQIFVASQFGSVTHYATLLTREEAQSQGGGSDPCDIWDFDGHVVPKEVARLDDIVLGYDAQLEQACKGFRQCFYDGGAFGDVVDKRSYLASDLQHLSIEGLAKAAEVAWGALQRAGLVPK